MFNFIQQLKNIKPSLFFKLDEKTQKPLITDTELLDLFYSVQNKSNLHPHHKDIAFRQAGDMRSIYRGHGMDYEESRHYQAGDDPRHMNWQLSARTGQHYMKVFREERQPGVFILLDRRNSMRFGTQQRLKVAQAAKAAALIAFSSQEKNYSIGGAILDKNIEWFKENKSKQEVFNFIQQVSRPAPPIFESQMDEPKIINILPMLNEILENGSILYLISDFHDLDKGNQATLLQLSSLHQVYALQITDPGEINLPNAGVITLKSSMHDKQNKLDSSNIERQEDYQKKANAYFLSKKTLFEDIAISHTTILTTDNKIEEQLFL